MSGVTSSATTPSEDQVPLLFVRGTHYAVGKTVGRSYTEYIKYYYNQHEWLPKFEAYYHTPEGRLFCEGFWQVAALRFPHYMEEVRGIADGAGIDITKVKLVHIERELATKLGLFEETLGDAPIGCTDMLVNTGDQILIAHNEDWIPEMLGKDILLHAQIEEYICEDGRKFPAETFLVHTWPGLLPGMNSGFNKHGLVFSIDHLFPKIVEEKKTADLFLCRHLLSASSLDQAVSILNDTGTGAAIGFCVNLGLVGDNTLLNVEVAPNQQEQCSEVDVLRVPPKSSPDANDGFYSHYNNYERLCIPAVRVPHCLARKETCQAMDKPTDMASLRNAIGDDSTDLPIYQKHIEDRPWCTVASVIMDISRKEMSFFRGSPKYNKPVACIPFHILPGLK